MKKPTSLSAIERQRSIFTKGMAGILPKVPAEPTQLALKAKDYMSKQAYAYIAGGAGLEETVATNRSDFRQWQIVPRMLNNVADCDLSVEILGQRFSSPLLLSPVGVLEMVHRSADKAVARACHATNIPFIVSNQASTSMEAIAKEMGDSPRWFQLYWSSSNDLVASLVQRAEANGYTAIVVTLDTTMLGWRIRDLDLAYLPFLRGKGIAQYTSDPVFQKLVDAYQDDGNSPSASIRPQTFLSLFELWSNYPGGFWRNIGSSRPLKAVRTFISMYTNPALNWEDLAFLREHTKLPIILKGILHEDDAHRAIDYGVDGIIVSNHGGRQVDGATSTIQALPRIVETVKGQLPIILDSGVRSGSDMFKALALGAKAVCIGRPYAYGLAIDGQRGVETVLRNYVADFELTMRLSGVKQASAIHRSMLKAVNK
ncbi:MAG: lactate 2-monooxygenase [Bacteroidota bacterium]